MHIGGEGETEKLAAGVKAALTKQKSRVTKTGPQGVRFPFAPERNSITPRRWTRSEPKGQAKDGMYKLVIGRDAKMPCGCEMGKEMGLNTWAAFAGTDDSAVVDGDFRGVGRRIAAGAEKSPLGWDQHRRDSPSYDASPTAVLSFFTTGARKLADGLKQTLAVQSKPPQ